MKLQHVIAGESATLSANGNILDDREEGDYDANVVAKIGSISSETGSIGRDSDSRLDVSISNFLVTDSCGNTNLNAIGDLTLTADTQTGILHVDGTGDLTIGNTDKYNNGNMNLGAIEAQGDVSITSTGGLILQDKLGRDAQVKGENIDLTAKNGNLGTLNKPLLVDTADGGVLSAIADNGTVVITEISDDMTIGTVSSTGAGSGVTLTTLDGSILESDKTENDSIQEALDAAVAAAQAQAKADALADQHEILNNYVDTLENVLNSIENANASVDAAQNALTQAEADENTARANLEQAEKLLEQLKETNASEQEIEQQQAAVDQAQADYNAAAAASEAKRNELNAAKEQLQSILDSADYNTFNEVEGLDEAKTAQDAINAINKELNEKTQELGDLQNVLNQAKNEAQILANEAERLKNKAEPSGISSDGDINLNINSTSKPASIGSSSNALGVNAEGDVNISAGEGTSFKNINLESGGDVSFAAIEATDEITIDAMGSITAAEGSSGPSITAPSTALNSLMGNIGSSETKPLKLSVDSVSASGVNVWISNDKNLTVDINASGDVGLTVDGDVNGDGDPNTPDIIGGDVDINANGDIGSENDPLDVESDEISADGNNIYLDSDSNVVIGDINASGDVVINTEGSVTDKGDDVAIEAENLTINAGGGIGTEDNPLDVFVYNNMSFNARYGHIFAENQRVMRTLIDIPTGIRVTGYFYPGAMLKVFEEFFHESLCAICAYLAAIAPNLVLGQYKLEVYGRWRGGLLVEIPVHERYEGKILTVAYCEDGELKALNLKVEGGYIRFWTGRLLAYTILDGVYTVEWVDGVQVLVDSEGVPIETIAGYEYPTINAAETVLHDDIYGVSIGIRLETECVHDTERLSFVNVQSAEGRC